MTEGNDGDVWQIPPGSSLTEISDELGIIPLAKGSLPEQLTTVNSITRKGGIQPFENEANFNVLFSAIFNFESSSESLQDQIWDLFKRALKRHFKENSKTNLTILRKTTFLLCKLMDETIKKVQINPLFI